MMNASWTAGRRTADSGPTISGNGQSGRCSGSRWNCRECAPGPSRTGSGTRSTTTNRPRSRSLDRPQISAGHTAPGHPDQRRRRTTPRRPASTRDPPDGTRHELQIVGKGGTLLRLCKRVGRPASMMTATPAGSSQDRIRPACCARHCAASATSPTQSCPTRPTGHSQCGSNGQRRRRTAGTRLPAPRSRTGHPSLHAPLPRTARLPS